MGATCALKDKCAGMQVTFYKYIQGVHTGHVWGIPGSSPRPLTAGMCGHSEVDSHQSDCNSHE